MFAYSTRVYDYMFDAGALRDELSVLFIGTPVPQIDTPFPDSILRKLAPVQLVAREIDRAPFAALSLVADIEGVLRAVHQRLKVDPRCWRIGARRSPPPRTPTAT